MAQERALDENKSIKPKPEEKEQAKQHPPGNEVANLQQLVGNRAVQRLIAQRSGEGAFELDDEAASRINQERSGGQPLDSHVQAQMGSATGFDFSGVRVHTSSEADNLNQDLSAKAFTTGQDIFFREGAYNPYSSSGQELIAHELTHVVQQGTGAVSGSGSGMTVNAPGDAFEQEADAVAKAVSGAGTAPEVQRQIPEEEEIQTQTEEDEEPIQMQEMEEDEEIMTKRDS